jgi:hypothetical protein
MEILSNFLKSNKCINSYVDLFCTTNIKWNQPQSAVRDAFNSINKFFRKIESKGQKIFVSADYIITKCIIMYRAEPLKYSNMFYLKIQ